MTSNSFHNSEVLVTGGAGFVGSNLVRELLERDVARVFIIDNLISSEISNIPQDPRIIFLQGSAADPRILGSLPTHLDFVWHLSCYHGNQSSIHDPIADHNNNLLPSLALFDHLSSTSTNLKKVVYSAAGCAVAEKTSDAPKATVETAPISDFHDSPYSISKIVGELYGNFYFSRHNLPFVRARFQNVYGPGEILGAGQWRGTPASVWRNVVPTFIWRAMNGLPINLDNGGSGSRDFIFVKDVVQGLLACAEAGQPGQAYNLASGMETSIKDLAGIIIELTSSNSELNIAPKRDWDNSIRRFGSTEKAASQLGFRAKTSLNDGLQETVEWTKANERTIFAAIERHDIFMRKPS